MVVVNPKGDNSRINSDGLLSQVNARVMFNTKQPLMLAVLHDCGGSSLRTDGEQNRLTLVT